VALLQAQPAAGAMAFVRWKAALDSLHEVEGLGAAGRAGAGAEASPVDLLWEVYGEQGTLWFHRLVKQPLGKAPGLDRVAVKGPDGSDSSCCVMERGGVARVGAALSAYFDGRAGGLYAPGPVDASAQDLLLDALATSVPSKEARVCLGPEGSGLLTKACVLKALAGAPKGTAPGSDGLTYGVYQAFWGVLGGPLVDCFNEGFSDSSAAEPLLPESQRSGVISLIHKGEGKPREQVASYRPITLLNCDYKVVARVLVERLAPAAEAVVDPGQTAFLPGRWIGDNILHHLELLDHCQAEEEPGCVLFLDFEKAYDRLDRGWLYRCLERLGFPAAVLKWVKLMLAGTRAAVTFHGHLSPWVDVLAGAAQGSPLSPLLYILAAQPLAARLRQLQRLGVLDGVRMPDGSLAPPCHQHADDTTIVTKTAAGAAVALQEAVHPFGAASNARLQVAKTHGMLLGPGSLGAHGVEAATGVAFVGEQEHVRHLGLLLSAGAQAAATRRMFEQRLLAVRLRIRDWCRFGLSYLGRLHVAKQVLASSLYYHASFIRPPPDLLELLVDCVDCFVVQGRLLEGPVAPLKHTPSAAVESLPYALGGLQRADIPLQIEALQAKVAAMLLHPKQLPWKVLMRRGFERLVPGLGPAVLVSQLRPMERQGRSGRLVGYWKALRSLAPHRRVEPGGLSAHHALRERLAMSTRVSTAAEPRGLRASGSVLTTLAGGGQVELTVSGLRLALASTDPAVVSAAQKVTRMVTQPEWRALLGPSPVPQPEWEVSECGRWVRPGGG
jgi:hypothetical protein